MNSWQASKALSAADDDIIALSQSPGADAIALIGGSVTLDTQRRVLLTSGGNDSSITFTVAGTNDAGNAISETVAGANASTAATTLDFKTVTSITHTGTVAGTLKAGTNASGSTPWHTLDTDINPMNAGIGVTVSGTVTYSIEYTFDDVNAAFSNTATTPTTPTVFTLSSMSAKTATADASILSPVNAVRATITSGTGTIKAVLIQAG